MTTSLTAFENSIKAWKSELESIRLGKYIAPEDQKCFKAAYTVIVNKSESIPVEGVIRERYEALKSLMNETIEEVRNTASKAWLG